MKISIGAACLFKLVHGHPTCGGSEPEASSRCWRLDVYFVHVQLGTEHSSFESIFCESVTAATSSMAG